jgi:hypothetical protein
MRAFYTRIIFDSGSSSSLAKPRKKRDWTAKTQADAGQVLGVGARQIAAYCSRGCPGKPGHYPLPEMIAWCKENVWTARRTDDDDDRPPQPLEKLREEKFRIAQLERLQLEAQLIPREDVRAGMALLADRLRATLQQIQRHHPDAAAILDEGLDHLQQEYREQFGDDSDLR